MRSRFRRLKSCLLRINPYLGSAALVALALLLARSLPEETELSTISIILLMFVLASATLWGLRPGLLAGLLAGLALDYYFIPPYYSFNIDDWRNAFSWCIFVTSALAVCMLAQNLRQRTLLARQRELLAKRLYVLSQRLSEAHDVQAVATVTVSFLGSLLGTKTYFLMEDNGAGFVAVAAHPKFAELGEKKLKTVIRRLHYFAGNTFYIDEASCTRIAVEPNCKEMAVLLVGPINRQRLGIQERERLISLVVRQASAAFQRVTLLRQVEEARIANEAEKMRSALLTSISHDLKTPLGIIKGAASGLQALGSRMSQRSAHDLLQAIDEECERLDQFIANLLDMSRVECEVVQPKREAIDLTDMVGSALDRAAGLLANHRIVLDLPADLPQIEVDPILAERALFNVLDNAAKYTPAGTRVTLSAVARGTYVVLEVIDEGPGIPESELPALFQKFYRVETGVAKPLGTGLGLAIARGFVQAIGGKIEASNRPDRTGTIFTIELPVSANELAALTLAAMSEAAVADRHAKVH